MAVTTSDDVNMTTLQKGLSEWWSEETEYVFQRIERWAAFARGYNRLRSERLSKGRLTMHEEQESRWSISSNKLIIEDPSWSPSFHTLKRSRRRSRQEEEMKINRYGDGVLGYRSNANLDSTCLESYRYDHSIYFKTIGEIRNGKKNRTESEEPSKVSLDDEDEAEEEEEEEEEELEEEDEDEEEEEESTFVYDSVNERFYLENEDSRSNLESNQNANNVHNVGVWPIVDLGKLDLNADIADTVDRRENEVDWMIETNNNYVEIVKPTDDTKEYEVARVNNESKDEFRGRGSRKDHQEGTKGILVFKMTKHRPSRAVKRSTVCGDNNVLWPGILLNYTRNVDPTSPASPHHHHNHHHHHYSGNAK